MQLIVMRSKSFLIQVYCPIRRLRPSPWHKKEAQLARNYNINLLMIKSIYLLQLIFNLIQPLELQPNIITKCTTMRLLSLQPLRRKYISVRSYSWWHYLLFTAPLWLLLLNLLYMFCSSQACKACFSTKEFRISI